LIGTSTAVAPLTGTTFSSYTSSRSRVTSAVVVTGDLMSNTAVSPGA